MPIGKWKEAHHLKTLGEFQAQFFATFAHEGTFRKYTGEPYIYHPATVAEIVRSVPHTEGMLCAAWLHDTLEDTDTTPQQLSERFGEDVAQMVMMVTDPSPRFSQSRVDRIIANIAHLSFASPAAQTIKLADIIDNVRDIAQVDPVFAAIYLVEKQRALEVLRRGDSFLHVWATELIRAQLKTLHHG